MKALGLLLLLPVTASAQYAYDYTSGPITSVTDHSYSPSGSQPYPLPLLGTDIIGVITLAQPLPQTGEVTVTPVSMSFNVQSAPCCYQFTTDASTAKEPLGSVSSFTAVTQNGAITGFNFQTGYPARVTDESMQASSGYRATFELASPSGLVLASAVDGGRFGQGAPEIDPAGAAAALTLLAAMLTMIRGRCE
jgi:hypothetical protein